MGNSPHWTTKCINSSIVCLLASGYVKDKFLKLMDYFRYAIVLEIQMNQNSKPHKETHKKKHIIRTEDIILKSVRSQIRDGKDQVHSIWFTFTWPTPCVSVMERQQSGLFVPSLWNFQKAALPPCSVFELMGLKRLLLGELSEWYHKESKLSYFK